jgi:hypothetical protein
MSKTSTELLNKTWTLSSESKENLNEEQFNEPFYNNNNNNSYGNNNNKSKTLKKAVNTSSLLNSTVMIEDQYKRIELSLKSSPTNFNLSSAREEMFVSEYRSLHVDFNRHQYEIEHIFNRICNMEFVSLFDENTNGLEFE